MKLFYSFFQRSGSEPFTIIFKIESAYRSGMSLYGFDQVIQAVHFVIENPVGIQIGMRWFFHQNA